MTDDDLGAIEQLLAAATPGPWWHALSISPYSIATLNWPVKLIPGQGARGEANAALIVAAVNALPLLIQSLREERAARLRAEAASA